MPATDPLSTSSHRTWPAAMHQPPPGRFHGRHAVVIGASISGLLAARVLSAHFDRVTVFDRDVLPASAESRRGVPQGRHGHGLLASGLRGLKTLFPTLERDLLSAGAVPGDVVGNMRWFQHGYYKSQIVSGLDALLMSRPLLEVTLRRQVELLPNVSIVAATRVLNLIVGGGRVCGVQAHQAGEQAGPVAADLVVDASGRSSRSPDWLASHGFERPAVDEVEVGIGYTTRTFKRLPTDLGGDLGMILAPTPPREKRVGFILAMEGNRWIVSLGGWLGNHCPIDSPGFLEFARSFARPDIYEVISRAEPLTEAVTYSFPSNLRRRYERVTRFPNNYLVMGDAACSFNPLYGQGISVATLEALALRECLDKAPSCDDVWRVFFKELGKIVDAPWMIAAGSDFAFDGVTGTRPAGTDIVNWYLARVHKAASVDRVVCQAFFEVANLLAPAPSLFRPHVVARVAKACLFPSQAMVPARASSSAAGRDGRRLVETH
jgi:2-polyprenyl-6-methoxyphenol hydroxylase-like FAD-dependent oxidoreductase